VLEHAPPNDKLYGNPAFGIQVTGNSNSIRAFWKPLREAGAAARAMLIQAAAQQWKVDPASCTAVDGQVRHIGSGRKLGFGSLVGAASKLAPPKNPPLKDPKDFTLIGKSLKRLDTAHKVDGGVVYGIDVMLPGMKLRPLRQVRCSAARWVTWIPPRKQDPGVRKVVVLDDMVAVVAITCGRRAGSSGARYHLERGSERGRVLHTHLEDLRKASEGSGRSRRTREMSTRRSVRREVRAAYELPFLAHATMEPLNCTVQLKPDSCEIWLGTQVITRVQARGDSDRPAD